MTTCMGKNYSFGVRAFREHSSIRECVLLFSFGFEGGVWVLILKVPDHCPFFTY